MAPERFVRILQIFGRITLIWPPDKKANNIEVFLNNCAWYCVVILYTASILLTMCQLGEINNDPVSLARTLAMIAIMCDSFFHLILVRLQWPRFEILVHEVTDFFRTARTYEKIVCEKYVSRYLGHHAFLFFVFVGAIGAFLCVQSEFESHLPMDTTLSIDSKLRQININFLQYFTTIETMCLLSGDFMMIMLLWYCTARLELLSDSMHHVHNSKELSKCAIRHESIIRFVRETNLAIDLVVLKSLTAVSIIILCAGLQLSYHTKWSILSHFFLTICVASIRLYGCAWAGDDLTEMGAHLSWGVYQCPAIFRSLTLSKSASIIIQASKRPLVVTVLGRNLVLSLHFFTRYSIKVMSFFMTLRACIERYV